MCENSTSLIKKIVDNFLEHPIRNLIISGLGTVGLVVLVAILFIKDWHLLGLIGDYIGGILGTLFAFVTVGAMIITQIQQGKEIKKSNAITAIQQFESTFFSLLNRHNSLHDQLLKDESFGKTWEAVFFKDAHSPSWMKITLSKNNEKIGPYFIFLYQIIKFIDTATVFQGNDSKSNETGKDQKWLYSNILRATVNTKLLQLLAVNCYQDENDKFNFPEFRSFIEKYSFFEHMQPLGIDDSYQALNEKAMTGKRSVTTLHLGVKGFADICDSYRKIAFDKSPWLKKILQHKSDTTPVFQGASV